MRRFARRLRHPLLLALLLASSFPLAALDPHKFISQYIHKKWTVGDGLPPQVLAIAQTPDGYIWLGTGEGLLVFDGIKFATREIPSMPARKSGYAVNNLVTDADGALWGVVSGTGLFRQDDDTQWFDERNGLRSRHIWTLLQDASGRLWIGTENAGLHLHQKGRITPFTLLPDQSSAFISALHVDRQGTLWAGSKRGLIRWQDGKTSLYSPREGLVSEFVTVLAGDRDGRLWIGTDKGLHVMKDGIIRPWKKQDLLAGIYVTAILEDRDGNLWVGTRGGLNRIQGEQVATLTVLDGLSNNYVRTLYQDMEGSLWVGTGGGLDQLRDGKMTTFSTEEGLSSEYITCIHEDRQGALWIGNGERGVDVFHNGVRRTITTREGLAHNNVSAFWSGRDGSIWIGTFGGGVNRLKNGCFTLFDTASGLSSNYINAVFEDSRGDVWIGTEGGGINRIRDGRCEWISREYGLPGIWIMSFHEDRGGSLWIISEDAGLFRFRDGRFDHFTTNDGLSDNNLTYLHEDEEGLLWVGTRRHGVNLFRDGRFRSFSSADGLFQDTVFCILEDQAANLWMSSPRGLFTVKRSDLLAHAAGRIRSLSCTVYGLLEGMRNIQCVGHTQNPGCKDRLGRLWFPTMDGVVMADPAQIRINQRPPEVRIEEFIVDGRRYRTGQRVELAPGPRNFEFHYTALLLAAPEQIRFQYRLQGFDREWIDAKDRRAAYYTAISPGDYRFQVIACNNDGIWNEAGASLAFRLRPFFYQTYWFFAACALALLGLGVMLFRIRLSSLRRRHKELARLVQDRTRQLEGEKEKLEKANAAKSEFMSFAAHDLRNPLHAVTVYAEMIGSEPDASLKIRQNARKVMQAAKRMVGLIDELMQSSVIESGQIAFHPKPIDVGVMARRIRQSYQLLAESKGQRLELSASKDLVTIGDEELIQQAFENILSNAVKYSPMGRTIWISLADCGDRLRFIVKDEGPGLNEEDQSRVFGRFQRLSAQPTGGEPSTGLGLFIVKQLVELHGGRIWVESEVGAGSTFTIELPRHIVAPRDPGLSET